MLAVLGNHDSWVSESCVIQSLASQGVKVLLNEQAAVSRGGETLYLAGVGDASYAEQDDVGAALAGVPAGAAVILLSHTPDIARKPGAAQAALVLAGHTHGGQIVLPWIGPCYVPTRLGRRYASGLHRMDGQWVFVNRGLGEVFPPLRIGCPPEIALLTLRRAP